MAGSRICHSSRNNPPLTDKDELAGGAPRASNNDSGTSFPIPAASYTLTFILALGLPDIYTNVDLQRATRLALKLFIKSQKHK